jgi:transketolase
VATGLGLEGYCVFAYAIAPFITMRCFEQIRVNLAILSQERQLNVNLVGVGAGFSYVVSGPTHHCLEDISIMRTLPNFDVVSPSDPGLAEQFVEYAVNSVGPKYFRFDAKPLDTIYPTLSVPELEKGFYSFAKGRRVVIVSTGYMTQHALQIVNKLKSEKIEIGLIDLFKLKKFDRQLLLTQLKDYESIITLEEGFIGKGGLDAAIGHLLHDVESKQKLVRLGLSDKYSFDIGSREYLYQKHKIDESSIMAVIHQLLN